MNKSNSSSNDVERSVWADLVDAKLPHIAGLAIVLVIAYLTALYLSDRNVEKLGQFGDSFGALTSIFNALAFAALIATVVLQSRELRDSRRELRKQAEAQEAWANLAAKQIELTKQLDSARIRPFLQMEWAITEPNRWNVLRIRNVGLGVAILQAIELQSADDEIATISVGTKSYIAASKWLECAISALEANKRTDSSADEIGAAEATPEFKNVVKTRVEPFDAMNCALPPGGARDFFGMYSKNDAGAKYIKKIRRELRLSVVFQSVNGELLSTRDQFAYLQESDDEGVEV